MNRFGIVPLALALVSGLFPPARGETIPVPLNQHSRLGQVFSSAQSLAVLTVIVPSWCDAEGGLTLSLWDSPARGTLFAKAVCAGVPDNAPVDLRFQKHLPPGVYYWEVDQRTGKSLIGLYADSMDADAPDCAYVDGSPQPRKRFLFRLTFSSFPFAGAASALQALTAPGSSLAERGDACRQLAAQGTPECVRPLASLLGNRELAHLARYALEPLPWPEAGAALREALPALEGALAAGVIHSLGARRDREAVALLRERLTAPDALVSRAAADSLGKIGTAEAATALLEALGAAAQHRRPALADGLLTAARRLRETGQEERAAVLFDELRQRELGPAIRMGAACGALEARGEQSWPALLEILRGSDPLSRAAALRSIQQGLPGEKITGALARSVPALPAALQPELILALGNRGDPAALPALEVIPAQGSLAARQALVEALTRLDGPQVAPLLGRLVRDPESAVASRAEAALGSLPGREADAAALDLLKDGDKPVRLAGIRLAGSRLLQEARPALLARGSDPEPEIRQAAIRVLKDLAVPADLPALLDLLARAASPADRDGLERAAAAACSHGEAERCAAELTRRLPAGDLSSRAACLRLLAGLGDRWGRRPVLAAAQGPEPELRSAALRILAQWKDPEAVPDLLSLAAATADPVGRALCLRASLRLAGAQGLPGEQALGICQQAAALVRQAEEKKLLLGTLGRLASPGALALARASLRDAEVAAEAEAAVVGIAELLVAEGKREGLAPVLEALAAKPPEQALGRRVQALLEKLCEPAR